MISRVKIKKGQIEDVFLEKDDYVGDKNYVYEQLSPTNNWTINHGLNKLPSVVITDSNGNKVQAKVTYINDNQVTITFNNPFIGKVIFN